MSETFGSRFVEEMRRLTNSTWGLAYGELGRAASMERDTFLVAFSDRLIPFGAQWLESHRQLAAEDLARAVVEEGHRRAKAAGTRWDPFDLLFSLPGDVG